MDAMTTLAARMAALADELEADPGVGGAWDSTMACVDRIRQELAKTEAATIWAVCHDEAYEDESLIATFTTRELAEEFAGRQDGSVDVTEEKVHDRVPEMVTMHLLGALIYRDGTVVRGNGYTQEYWDYDPPLPVEVQQLATGGWHVMVWQATADETLRVLLEHVEILLGQLLLHSPALEPEEWMAWKMNAAKVALDPKPVVPIQRCYDASFGRVHFKSSCRCVR